VDQSPGFPSPQVWLRSSESRVDSQAPAFRRNELLAEVDVSAAPTTALQTQLGVSDRRARLGVSRTVVFLREARKGGFDEVTEPRPNPPPETAPPRLHGQRPRDLLLSRTGGEHHVAGGIDRNCNGIVGRLLERRRNVLRRSAVAESDLDVQLRRALLAGLLG